PRIFLIRAPQCRQMRGDETTNTEPFPPALETDRGNCASAPRPHKTSYAPFAAWTLIFFILSLILFQRTKNVTQLRVVLCTSSDRRFFLPQLDFADQRVYTQDISWVVNHAPQTRIQYFSYAVCIFCRVVYFSARIRAKTRKS